VNLREYYQSYESSSKLHAENIMKYGPKVPFGYPDPLPEQLNRIDFITSSYEGLTLDIGSDSGYILHRFGGGVGIDISLLRIRVARHLYPELVLVHSIAEHLPFRGIFNTVIIAELLEHVLDPNIVLVDAHKALRPKGRLVVTVPDEIYGKSHMNPEHLRKFTEGQLRNLLSGRFFIDTEEYVVGDYPSWCFCCEKGEVIW